MTRVVLGAVLVVGIAIRLATALPVDRPLASDEIDYDRLAWTLATTGSYADDGRPTAYRPVGYPAFVAAVYALAGRSPRAVRAVQAVLDTATAWLLFVALRRRSVRAATAAAAIWAFYPPAIVTATLIYPETLFALLAALAAVGLLAEPDRSHGFRLAIGVLFGVLTLLKIPAIGIVVLLPWFIVRGERRWARAAVIACGTLLVLVPWAARNARAVGTPVLATAAASNLLIGNHPNATGGYATDVPEAMRPRASHEAEAAREAARAAGAYIAARPLEFVARIPVRWAHLLMGEGELALVSRHPAPEDSAASYRERVKQVGAPTLLSLWIPYALLLLVGTAGLLVREPDAFGALFLALVASWLVAHGMTFGGGRHHAAWMPFLAAFAAERLAGVPGTRPFRGARRAVWLAVAACACALWLLEGAHYL